MLILLKNQLVTLILGGILIYLAACSAQLAATTEPESSAVAMLTVEPGPAATPGPKNEHQILPPTSVPLPVPPFDSQNLSDSPLSPDRGKSGHPNLSPLLNMLVADWPDGPGVSQVMQQGVEIIDNRVKVMLVMQNETAVKSTIATLSASGGDIIAHQEIWIDAWIPVEVLRKVADLPGISIVREPPVMQHFN